MESTLTVHRVTRPGPRDRYGDSVVLRRRAGTAAHVDPARVDPARVDHAFASGEIGLEPVYRRHAPLVHAICRRTLDESAADDVTQDVFISAWRARHQFDPDRGALGAWLVGITRRKIIDHIRSEARHADRRHTAPSGSDDPVDRRTDIEIGRTIDRLVVADALRSLPERVREVVVLAHLEGLTHQEIAERTRLPLGTVKSDVRRGLARIRESLEATHA